MKANQLVSRIEIIINGDLLTDECKLEGASLSWFVAVVDLFNRALTNFFLNMLVSVTPLRETTAAQRAHVGFYATVQFQVVQNVTHLCIGLVADLALEQLDFTARLRIYHPGLSEAL